MEAKPPTVVDEELLEATLKQARSVERKRALHFIHAGKWEHAHRSLNAFTPPTYVQPHRHHNPYASEAFTILKGKVAVLILSDEGEIEKYSLILEAGKSPFGIDIKPGTWHAVVALKESVLYEVKGQPNEGYVEDKEFAPFAPKEGSPESAKYLEDLKKEIHKRF